MKFLGFVSSIVAPIRTRRTHTKTTNDAFNTTMSASDKISFMNKFIKFISLDGLELWWKIADQSKQVQGAKSLLLSSFCLLEWGEGNSPALPESRQTFEVAAAQTSRRVNRVFSHQTVFFFRLRASAY